MAPLDAGDRERDIPLHRDSDLDLGDILQGLLFAGHTLGDILHTRQRDEEGRELPYAGWTLPQVRFWSQRADGLVAQLIETAVEIVKQGIGAVLDPAHSKKVSKTLEEMNAETS